ncbi:MAG: SRPBCC family protein [Planctomycetaceae bacterium]
MVAQNESNELRIIRRYDAPVQAVWGAWTDPAQVEKWWGPRGFTLTSHSHDLRPGGHWHYTMHGQDGVDYVNKTKYFEVEPCAKLVYDHGGNEDEARAPLFRVRVLFSEERGGTRMDLTMTLSTPEAAKEMKDFIKKAGGNATWDRLAEYLEHKSTGREQFVINRTFDAPLETMFEMWTNPKHFSQWLAPTGFQMEFIRSDIRPGGSTFYFMTGNGAKMFGRAEYRTIDPSGCIVYTQQFCDEHETISRHPLAPTWPQTMLTTVVLTAEGQDQTRVTVTWEPFGVITKEELETFINARTGMTQGWTGSFDKLEAYLSQV